MKQNSKWMIGIGQICMGLLLLLTVAPAVWAQKTDFSGEWEQDNDRCQPKRNRDVALRIVHRDPQLTVETSMARDNGNSRVAQQKYTTDGKVSVSTGADGDEFHTSVTWKGSSLVFSIEEHEDGRVLQSVETWSVIEDGATMQRIRERPNGDKQILFYRRQRP